MSKDQLDILNSLRQSVDAEKSEITNENVELKNSIKKLELHDKEMLEKMNKILIDKVDNKELEKAGMTDQDKNYMSQLLGEINKPSDREHILNESLLEAKQILGNDIVITGNVPPVDVMYLGNTEDVKKSVKECIDIGYDSPCGYVLSTGCQIPKGTKMENIDAFMEYGREFGNYKRLKELKNETK